jgi:23S rRNA pseudouridine1911/1915/1917 synthase
MKLIKIIVNASQSGLNIDKAIMESGIELSRKEVRRILDKGGIQCNGKRVFVASHTVKRGDQITLTIHSTLSAKEKEWAPLKNEDVLYDKHGIIAINKPPGLASVPTGSSQTPYAKKLLAPLLKAKGLNPEELTACHRLDKETSGILLFALGETKAQWIMEQFKNHTIEKVYHALCYGIPTSKMWEIQCQLSSIDKRTGMVKIVKSGGYSSSSSFQLIAVSKKHNLSLIRIKPKTGRSHQIRVHLLHSKLPIIGDKKYTLHNLKPLHPSLAELSFQHHFLHASALSFTPAEGEPRVELHAPLTPLFDSFIKRSHMEFFGKDNSGYFLVQ